MPKYRRSARRALVLGGAALAVLALAGCSQETLAQWGRWGLPVAASEQAPWIGNLFNVHVVSVEEYNAYLKGLAAKGQTGELRAPVWANTVPSPPAEEEQER